jgi:uncharacterized membrane protein
MKIKFTKQINRLIIISLLFLFFQSCENLIEIDLPDDQINTEDVFKDIHTTQAALANLYINIRQGSIFNGSFNGIGTILSLYCDDLDAFGSPNTPAANFDFYHNTLLSSNNTISNLWNTSYNHIYTINAFIDGLINSSSIEEENKSLFLGEAYFIRALYYHYLTQLFGNIPYITATDYKHNSTVSKINSAEVLKHVENDLKESLQLISGEYRNSERIYPNKTTAELLLAKNYLLQKQYMEAERYAQTVIDNVWFKLETQDINLVFKKTAQSTIWQLPPGDSGAPTLEASNYPFTNQPTLHHLSNDLIIGFEDNDKRKHNWIKEIISEESVWYHAYKYKNSNSNDDEYSIVFRIEDAYFVLIEALAYQNKITEAVKYLNVIRQRAGLPELPDTLSQSELIDEMLSESRREFFCEQGHRFLDLKRNNQLNLLKTIKPNWEDKHTVFPIPENEILINPNLLPQNHGY